MAAAPPNRCGIAPESRPPGRDALPQVNLLVPPSPASVESPTRIGVQPSDSLRAGEEVSLQLGDDGLFAQRYRPEVEVGRGGAGVVYRAKDMTTGGTVALKVLQTETRGAALSSEPRVAREAKALSRLTSPYVPRLHALFQDRSGACIVMDFVDGPTLAAVLKEAPLDERRAVRLALQLAIALGDAHEAGFLHRDIKSSNVRLADVASPSEQAMLLDFGATKAVAGDPSLTGPGLLVGTVRYVAPEQILGKAADHRSDIYSLGLVIYEMLTGRRPYRSGDLETHMRAHLFATPIPMHEARPEVHITAETEAIARRCLAKSPDARFQSMAELRAALESRLANLAGDGAAQESSFCSNRRPFVPALHEPAVSRAGVGNSEDRATVPDGPGKWLAFGEQVDATARTSPVSDAASEHRRVFIALSSLVLVLLALVVAFRLI